MSAARGGGTPESCRGCASALPEEADWCLECGLAAHTRVVPSGRWWAAGAVAGVAAVCLLAAVLAVVAG
ncbi:MAG: hypothetical protein ABSG64_04150 [Solirubrobacteraceae bacterium]|jgi:predicted amidophosphoribosyltransferase